MPESVTTGELEVNGANSACSVGGGLITLDPTKVVLVMLLYCNEYDIIKFWQWIMESCNVRRGNVGIVGDGQSKGENFGTAYHQG